MRILLTRPELQGERTAVALRTRGHHVLHAPLLHIEPDATADLGEGPWSAVVMTSGNAAHAISTHRRRNELLALPAIVVGERTKDAAMAAGFENVATADGDVEALAELVTKRIPQGRSVLYLAGEDRASDLGAALQSSGYVVSTAIVYRAMAATAFPPTVLNALKTNDLDAVLHFSRRSAEIFLRLAENASCLVNVLKYNHFCLSAQVAAPLLKVRARVAIAARPNEKALLDLVGDV